MTVQILAVQYSRKMLLLEIRQLDIEEKVV